MRDGCVVEVGVAVEDCGGDVDELGAAGVVEVGLFCGLAKAAYFGNEDGSVTGKFSDGSVQEFKA